MRFAPGRCLRRIRSGRTQNTVTPHTSARTLWGESIAQIAGKLRALQRGKVVTGVVDAVCGYGY